MRPTDQRQLPSERWLLPTVPKRRGHTTLCRESTGVGWETNGMGGVWVRASMWSPRERMDKAGGAVF